MNSLDRSLVEKAGNDNGWERVMESSVDAVRLASARHPLQVRVSPGPNKGSWVDMAELSRGLPRRMFAEDRIVPWDLGILASVLRRAAELAIALPDTPRKKYEKEVADALKERPDIMGTEAERVVRQRIGQNVYREALMQYWGGACAVTGLDVPEVLRASHAKPWADCETDAERLNVYNGLLLEANIDALFDKGLISFTDMGKMLISQRLKDYQRRGVGLSNNAGLRWVHADHLPFLKWHRERVFRDAD